jgi:hypothetical protein
LKVENSARPADFIAVKTLTVDDEKRVRLPDAQPRQVFAYESSADGSIHLMPVKEPASTPGRARLERRDGRTLAVTDHALTNEDVQRVMESFP